jgi:hypothetical protein
LEEIKNWSKRREECCECEEKMVPGTNELTRIKTVRDVERFALFRKM